MSAHELESFLEPILPTVQAVKIHAFDEFSWFGQREGRLPTSIRRELDVPTVRAHLVSQLQQRLYKSFYSAGFPESEIKDQGLSDPGGDPAFVSALSAANHGRGNWMNGWTARVVTHDNVLVQRTDLKVYASREYCRPMEDDSLREGAQVEVLFPKEQLGISPGYYMVISDEAYAIAPTDLRVRVYWHISASGGVPLVREITKQLNQSGAAYRFKILNDPSKFNRCDSAVLYFHRSGFDRILELIARTYEMVSPWIKPGTPPFTKQLAAGLALAEDPPDGSSFGFLRCEILAEGIVRAHEVKAKKIEERMEVIRQTFSEKGVSFETAYLNPGSSDIYNVVNPPSIAPASNQTAESTPATLNTANCLDTACDVAERLAEAAYKAGDRCTWMTQDVTAKRSGLGQNNYETIGPSLYDGTAGIAFFLSELAHRTNRTAPRDLAFCAIRQAVTRLKDVPEPLRFGLHVGWLGIALCEARIGVVNDAPALVREACDIVDSIATKVDSCQEYDITGGLAGGVLALLALSRLLNKPQYMELSIRLGDRLVMLADDDIRGTSWVTPGQHPTQNNLTGYSHGTAGAYHALFELYALTQNEKFRSVGERACAYEDSWFSEQNRNWPDFRLHGESLKRTPCEYEYMSTWCHGAPGIAISRARAYQILNDKRYAVEAEMALQTTKKTLQTLLLSPTSDVCICHGLLGNAEILTHCNEVLYGKSADHEPIIHEVVQAVISRYRIEHGNSHERVGNAGPGMMMGISGTGYALLRRSHNSLPSILDISHWD